MSTTRFYDVIRPLFGGRMTQNQVDGTNAILAACRRARANRQSSAYIMATAFHETGARMEPVREGFAKSDEAAIAIVTRMFEQGRISKNYAAVDPETGQSYYGRGYVQLTWHRNYKRVGERLGLDLVNNPDLALDPQVSARILVEGMLTGAFTGVSLDDVSEPATSEPDFLNDRAVVNGRDRAAKIAGYANVFYEALADVDLLADSRTIRAAKAAQKSSNTGIAAATVTATIGAAGQVLTEETDSLIATAQKAFQFSSLFAWQNAGEFIAVALVLILIYQRTQARKIEDARREDNEVKGV